MKEINHTNKPFLFCLPLMKIITLLLSFLLVSTFALNARVITVGPTGDYQKIQDAIDASVNIDEIIVSPGTYNENINFNGKNIILRSTYHTDTNAIKNTIIDGQQLGSVVAFSGTENETCVIEGFTITGGKAIYGGGIEGGSIDQETHSTIRNNIIRNNTATDGGGLFCCDGLIINNIICGNSAGDDGGGILYCDGLIINNTIYGNTRGGVFSYGLIINNIIFGNTSYQLQSWYHTIPLYSCIQGWTEGGTGNISFDPLFVDPENGDFHLKPLSPCINQGNYSYLYGNYLSDIDNNCRLAYGQVDMGCYEYNSSLDSDGDLLSDADEILKGSSASLRDTDGDGLIDGAEVLRGTNPIVYNFPVGISIPSTNPKIQQGIFFALPKEIISVSSGLYDENILLLGKDIVLRGANPQNTIIDGGGRYSVIRFLGNESNLCEVSNFTIRGSSDSFLDGGGIAGYGTKVTIINNIIRDNKRGGIANCNGLIRNNWIFNNLSSAGGGLYNCDGTIQNNFILGNSNGGLSHCDGIIINNLIANNSDGRLGGGLTICHAYIVNNTIVGNHGGDAGGGLYDCNAFVANCIIWGNTSEDNSQIYDSNSPIYSCIQDWTKGGNGNITDDPKFKDVSKGDYALTSNSPCIDKGNNYYLFGDYIADINGECRVWGASVDMGFDEYGSFPDSDGDLLADTHEKLRGTSSNNIDTDGDGLIDGFEVLRGTNPKLYNSPIGISIPSDFPNVQQGIALSFPSEIIIVSQGTYKENLYFPGKNIILQSSNPYDESVVDITIIDGQSLCSVVTFSGKEDESCKMMGLTLRNGLAVWGGGINGNKTNATVEYNKITNNKAIGIDYKHRGGGIFNFNGIIINNIISNNIVSGEQYYTSGGGLYGCNGLITGNKIINNISEYEGGGLHYCDGIISNNEISSNIAIYGGGICNSIGTIINNIIINNSASDAGGGIKSSWGEISNNTICNNNATRGSGLDFCWGEIKNCIIWGNVSSDGYQTSNISAPSYSCIQNWSGGTGNINADPQLVDPENGDFHLKATSPCIDAGCYIEGLTQDFEGEPRGFNGSPEPRGDGSDYDMGADEYIKSTNVDSWSLWE